MIIKMNAIVGSIVRIDLHPLSDGVVLITTTYIVIIIENAHYNSLLKFAVTPPCLGLVVNMNNL